MPPRSSALTPSQSRPQHYHTRTTSFPPTPSSSATPLTISRTSSRTGTPRSHSRQSSLPKQHHPVADLRMAEGEQQQPVTPTPKKGRRRRKPVQRREADRLDDSGIEQPAEEDEGDDVVGDEDEMLFDLLGVTSPARTPVMQPLRPTAADEGKQKDRRGPGKKQGSNQREVASEGEVRKLDREAGKATNRRNRQPRNEVNSQNQKGITDASHDLSPQLDALPQFTQPQPSALSASRPKASAHSRSHTNGTAALPKPVNNLRDELTSSSNAFDTANLSKSLPSGGASSTMQKMMSDGAVGAAKQRGNRAKGAAGSGDESLVWDMPDGAGPTATQQLTWQQRLQSPAESTPRRGSNRSTPSDPSSTRSKPKARAAHPPSALTSSTSGTTPSTTRPAHARRLSLESSLQLTPSSSLPPTSLFDHTIPYHTGLNANRAPQTPARALAAKANMPPTSGPLPVLNNGDFPRLFHTNTNSNKGPIGALQQQESGGAGGGGGGAGEGGGKYAGPTFHNSPSGASLPKPDLEDF